MSRLSLKTLKRNNLPYGKYTFMVLLTREMIGISHCQSNASDIEKMRDLLRTTCKSAYRLDWKPNYSKRRVYTKLYLCNAMDLAMVKLVHADKLYKIYKIKVEAEAETT